MKFALPLIAIVLAGYAASSVASSETAIKKAEDQRLLIAIGWDDPKGPNPRGPNPNGPDPRGPDPKDELHDPNHPANKEQQKYYGPRDIRGNPKV